MVLRSQDDSVVFPKAMKTKKRSRDLLYAFNKRFWEKNEPNTKSFQVLSSSEHISFEIKKKIVNVTLFPKQK